MSNQILFYREYDTYGEFSNFAKYPVVVDNKVWPTSEHYFQAMKFPSHPDYQEMIRNTSSPYEIKKLGSTRQIPLRNDWEDVKEDIMMKVLRVKFSSYSELEQLLLSTGDATLIEHTKNDKYWADGGDGTGKNRLGILLMKLRDELRT